MRGRTRPLLTASTILALALLLAGCPKRPVLSGGPPPSGGGSTAGSPRGVAATPADPGGRTPAGGEYRRQDALAPVRFAFDSARLGPGEAGRLEQYARWLNAHPDHSVLIDGHADERGTPDYNVALGERRAEAVRAFLVGRGVPAERLRVASSGERRPACPERTADCQARNRRVTFLTRSR